MIGKLFKGPTIENPLPEKEAKIPTTGEVGREAKLPESQKIKGANSIQRTGGSLLAKPGATEETSLAESKVDRNGDPAQTTEPSSGISLEEAPKSLQKALNFLPKKAREELTVFKVDEKQYQISFGPNFFPHGLKGLMHALNPLKSHIQSEAEVLLKQSESANNLMPLLKQGKLHMQTLFEADEKTAKLIDISLSDSPHGLLEDIFNGNNHAMKKLLTGILDQILPEANVKKKKDETAEINLSEESKKDFLTLQAALKEKNSEAALAKAQPIIDAISRTYEIKPLRSTDAVQPNGNLNKTINTLLGINGPKAGINTTIFTQDRLEGKFSPPNIEIEGFTSAKGEFKRGTLTIVNHNPEINLPLTTLLTTLQMALFANNRKITKELQLKLIEAAIENTKSAAAISAESQAKTAVADLN